MNSTLLPDNVTIRSCELDVASIVVRQRQRDVDPAHVELLMKSIAETRTQIVPIAVSERSDGTLILVDGAHRLEAMRQAGLPKIRAEVYTNLIEDQEGVLEFVTNRARRDLSPAEILVAWETFEMPLYQLEGKKRQSASGHAAMRAMHGTDESKLIPAGNKLETAPSMSLSEVAIAKTGHKPDWLKKVKVIRDLAESEVAPEAVREVAKRGFAKLQDSNSKVEPVYREILKVHEAVIREAEDPDELLARDAEDRLDEMVRYTTLLEEKLDGNLRDFLKRAAQKDQMGRNMLRTVRVALVRALTSIVVIECEVSNNTPESLRSIGAEVTSLLKEESMKALGLRQDDEGAQHA